MQQFRLYIIAFCVTLANGVCNSSFAQNSDDQNLPGKIKYQETHDVTWSGLFKTIPTAEKSYFEPLEKSMARACFIITDVSALKPLRGFNISPYVSSSNRKQNFNHYPVLLMDVTFCNYSLYTDKRTHQVKQAGEWGTSIRIFINDPSWLIETDYDILNNCDSLGIPYFYYKPLMHKDKNGYWVTTPNKVLNEIRVIKKKGVPLYIPVTQKEYLEYKQGLAKRGLASRKKRLVNDTKKLHNLEYPQNRSYFESSIKYDKKFILDYKNAIRDYQQALNGWSSQKLNAPAYTSIFFIPGEGQNQIDLVPANYKGAREFVRLNNTYFDKTLPEGTAQLILVGAQDDPHFSISYMAQKVHSWFDQIDYKKLQEMIR